MSERKEYTREEKIEYFEKRIAHAQKRLAELKGEQDFSERVSEQIPNAELVKLIRELINIELKAQK